MNRWEKRLKGAVRQALAMVLASAMMLLGMPVSAMEFLEEESSVEVSDNAFFEETAESSEIEQRVPETEETENKNTASETEEIENKNTMLESEFTDINESTMIIEDNLITATENENDGTEAESVQTEENTETSESNNSEQSDIYDPMEVDAEPTTFVTPVGDIVYDAKEGADNTKTKYNLEGYAASANVTGGGLLREDSPCYHKVSNELEFIQTLGSLAGVQNQPHVIEITTDLNLGDLELNEKYKNDKLNVTKTGDGYNNLIRAHIFEPLIHPTLKKTGVSYIKLHDFHNLTIFSKNGATIKHTGIRVGGGSGNIIIRNLAFDELWEWDEATSGEYDRNDWDYMTIEDNAEGIWIDHCTFYKAYDGIIDVKNLAKNPIDYQRVTISWCEILPGSKDNIFFNEQMTWLEEHIDETNYYKQLRNENMRDPNKDKTMSAKDVWYSAYGQKKTHLLGCDDSNIQDKAIRVTFANNYYKNSMSRLPRLRYGKVHEYNCIFDSQELHTQHSNGNPHISGIGAISTWRGEMLLENCYIYGLRQPLKTAPGAGQGYVNAVDCLYYMDGKPAEIKIAIEGTLSETSSKITDEVRFRERLPYKDYTKYDASKLKEFVLPYVGAGKLTMTTAQWERTKYNIEEGGNTEESSSVETSSVETSETDESGSVLQEGLYIVGLKETYDYTGAKIIPDIEVWDYDIPGGRLLTLGTDYTVAYKNNINPGTNTAEVIVKGKGNYSGKDVTKRFSILKITDGAENLADLKGAKIDKIDSVVYKGDAWYPDFTIKLKDGSSITYTQNTDTADGEGLYRRTDEKPMNINVAVSNNVNKGTATIFVTGAPDAKTNKATSIRKTFKIAAADISTASVAATEATYAVSGAVPSSVTVKYGKEEKILKAGKDYTVKYAKNKTAGEGTVTIIGKGNYTKKCAPVPYTIEKLDMSTLKVNAVTASIGGKPQKIKAMINDGKGSMLKEAQYQLSVYMDKDGKIPYTADRFEVEGEPIYVAATAKEGSKDLTGSTSAAEFKVGIDISKAIIVSATTGKAVTKTYTGNAIELTGAELRVTLKVKGERQPRTLIVDQDYIIATHFNNINKGSATVVIQGINSYGGTKAVKFKITQKSVENLKKWEEMANALKNVMNSY